MDHQNLVELTAEELAAVSGGTDATSTDPLQTKKRLMELAPPPPPPILAPASATPGT
jgi:bacteriocin-like protein